MAELPWLPLPPGKARCCFLGTRKLAPTLQIMINMLLNGIIVLSNCEMLILPTNKATGLDKIPCRLVKLASPFIADSLCNIFNMSIISGIFPLEWKVAKVIPIHKDNEKDELNNYRPFCHFFFVNFHFVNHLKSNGKVDIQPIV